jgi:hypothetical protein
MEQSTTATVRPTRPAGGIRQCAKSDGKTKPDDGKWVAPINNTLYSLFETVDVEMNNNWNVGVISFTFSQNPMKRDCSQLLSLRIVI